VAIANSRLISADETGVTFKWKDYRIEGPRRYKTMTLSTDEFTADSRARRSRCARIGITAVLHTWGSWCAHTSRSAPRDRRAPPRGSLRSFMPTALHPTKNLG